MAEHSKGPSHVWLFVKLDCSNVVVGLNSEFSDIRLTLVEGDPVSSVAKSAGWETFLLGEKYGTYQGVIGGRPVYGKYGNQSELEVRKRLARRHPTWSPSKIDRATTGIMTKMSRNLHTDHETRDYKRLWTCLCKIVTACSLLVLIYDDGNRTIVDDVIGGVSGFKELIATAYRFSTTNNDFEVLRGIVPYVAYVLQS